MSKRLAIVCSDGLGDGLVMLIASCHLRTIGYEPVIFSPHLSGFGPWLPEERPRPHPKSWPEALETFDAVLLQHDNTARAHAIASLRTPRFPVYVFYTNYRLSKHGPLPNPLVFDYCFDESRTMVDNIVCGLEALFSSKALSDTGLRPPAHLVHRKFDRRVALHPISGHPFRNWPKRKFLALSKRLKSLGFEPFFLLTPDLRGEWPEENALFFSSLQDLAAFIYESGYFIGNNSGPGHLASSLSIPTLILGHQELHLRFWRPGWLQGGILFPSRKIPKPLRDRYWKLFISIRSVLNSFKSNVLIK